MRKSLFALTTLSTLALPAFADQEHYVNLIQGGRPMGMGGAYTAVADDPAGLFYNPSGIVYAKSANLSASVNAFRIANKTYENVLIGNTDWSRESTGVVPNYFGMIQPFGPFSVGFSIAVTDTTEEDQAQSFNFSNNAASNVSRFTINLNQTNTVNKIGPSIAYRANEEFSIGLTLYLHLRNEKQIVNQYVEIKGDENDLNAKNVEWQNAYYKNDEVGITPKLGIMWSPNDKLTLGATLSQNYVISSDGYLQTSCLASDATQESEICDPASLDPLQSAGKLSNSHMDDPLELSFGLAYQTTPDLLLTGDLNYYSEETGREAVVNIAMGMEYLATPEWAVRAGFYTNMSNSPKPEINSLLEQIDYYGGSASITRFNKNSSISAGVNLQYGTGTSGAVNPNQLTDITAYDLTLFLATSYSY